MKPSIDRPHGGACKISGVAIVFPAKNADRLQRFICIISSRSRRAVIHFVLAISGFCVFSATSRATRCGGGPERE